MDTVTVTLVRQSTTRTKYGDGTTTTTLTDVLGCLFAPGTSTERVNLRDPAVMSGGTIYFPAGAPLPDSDDVIVLPPGAHLDPNDNTTVVYDGEAYQVEGDVGVWGDAGAEVAVQRWSQQ